jgi:hypothetical protein
LKFRAFEVIGIVEEKVRREVERVIDSPCSKAMGFDVVSMSGVSGNVT